MTEGRLLETRHYNFEDSQMKNREIHFRQLNIEVDDVSLWVKSLMLLWGMETTSSCCLPTVQRRVPWVFRGQRDANWKLASSYERARERLGLSKLNERLSRISEYTALEEFKRNASHLLPREPSCQLEWLALMQHYGAPTRLLDFSESPFVALYFALDGRRAESEDTAKSRSGKKNGFSVWAINLSHLLSVKALSHMEPYKELASMQTVLADIKANTYPQNVDFAELGKKYGQRLSKAAIHYYDDEVLLDAQRQEAEQLLGIDQKGRPNWTKLLGVIPIRLPRQNPRSSAQQGLFLFPKQLSSSFLDNYHASISEKKTSKPKTEKISTLFSDERKARQSLTTSHTIKFTFPVALTADLQDLLDIANVNSKTLFPGLEGVVKDLKYTLFPHQYGWNAIQAQIMSFLELGAKHKQT